MVASNPVYRNNRQSFYQEKGPDSLSIGTIINVFKTKDNSNSFDTEFRPSSTPINGTAAYDVDPGDPQPYNNPEFQYYGYLYCDGSEYNIKDYPLLFESIGNKYGGTAGNVGGVPVTQTNVFEFWPEDMGTFKVPDLKAKKVVGFGPVYGSGSPAIGNVELQVGVQGGKWYLSKDTQEGFFNLGNIRTTGYTDVVADVAGQVVGYQQIDVTLADDDLNGAPVHDHFLLHSEVPQVQGFDTGFGGDPYLTGYRTRNGRVQGFSPAGGIKLTHSHVLSKQRLTGQNIATYDVFNYAGGDQGPGSLNPAGNYFASGGGGTFEEITYTPQPLSKVFTNSSEIGGRSVSTGGTPFYEETEYEYNVAGTYAVPLTTDIDVLAIEMIGGGGSGGVWTTAGSNGTASTVLVGDGSGLTLTAGGGTGGLAVAENTGSVPYVDTAGGGGPGGASTVAGTYANDITIDLQATTIEGAGSAGAQDGDKGKFWNGEYDEADPNWRGIPQGTSDGGSGSFGEFLSVTSTVERIVQDVTYPSNTTFFASSQDPTIWALQGAYIDMYGAAGAQCQNFGGTYTTGIGQYSTNSGGCTTGGRGNGKYARLSINPDSNGDITGTFYLYPGGAGSSGYPGTGGGGGNGSGGGGSGGDGYIQDGGGGGGAGLVYNATATNIIAGIGGGGGGGGAGEGQCGDDAYGNPITDGMQAVSQNLFVGGGGNGGNYGCTGGGGGGGGGGVGLASQTGGAAGPGDSGGASAGGPGGGGGGFGGHGGGYGGARGLSSYRSDFFSVVSSGDVNHNSGRSSSTPNGSGGNNGRMVGFVNENRNNWTASAGGGGMGGRLQVEVPDTVMQPLNASSVTVTVGSGGNGVTGGIVTGNPSAFSRTISSGYVENATPITSADASDGYVKVTTKKFLGTFGGNTDDTIGDVVIKGSEGVDIYASGSGQTSAGGFKLPTTQAPIVQILAQGDQPGGGATATAVVSNGVVTGVNLGNGGSGYLQAPEIRFLGGSGGGTQAIASIDASGSVNNITIVSGSSSAYTRYVKIGGAELERFITITASDTTDVVEFGVKACRGNNINGGELPDDSADDLVLYYNTDGSDNFPASNFVGVLVPRPTSAEIASSYDGNGSGTAATNWFTYTLTLPSNARAPGTKFQIKQKRSVASGSNDNASDGDHFGIVEFLYYYDFITDTQFVGTSGEISSDAKTITYNVEGSANALHPAGYDVNDMRFTLSAGTPLTPTPALDPVKAIPLIEPYCLTKYLIKAF